MFHVLLSFLLSVSATSQFLLKSRYLYWNLSCASFSYTIGVSFFFTCFHSLWAICFQLKFLFLKLHASWRGKYGQICSGKSIKTNYSSISLTLIKRLANVSFILKPVTISLCLHGPYNFRIFPHDTKISPQPKPIRQQ